MNATARRRLALFVCLLAGAGVAAHAAPPTQADRAEHPREEAGLQPAGSISAEGVLRLAGQAGRVVLARCLDVEPANPDASSGGNLLVATFQVEETFKGPDRATLRIRFHGGAGLRAPKAGATAWSSDETLHYAPAHRNEPGDTGGSSPADEARQERLARLSLRPARPASPTTTGTVPPRFHPGERALIFLPRTGRDSILAAGAPGYAKLAVVEAGPPGADRLVPVAGPAWLTAPATGLGSDAPVMDVVLDALRRGLQAEEEARREAPGRGHRPAEGARP